MTAKEVCDALGISRVTLHRRMGAGVIKPLPKSPGLTRHYKLLFRKEDVEKLLQQSDLEES